MTLDDDVQFARRRAVPCWALRAFGVRTVRDLIEYFPFRHELTPLRSHRFAGG